MRRWKPEPAPGQWIGFILLLGMLGGVIYYGKQLALALAQPPDQWPVNLTLFGELVFVLALLVAIGALVYRLASGISLTYEMDRNGIYVQWLGNRAVIPLSLVESVESGMIDAQVPWWLLQGLGAYWGQGYTHTGRRLNLFSTLPLSESLLIHTPHDTYAISPADVDSFVQDLEQRRRLGAVTSLTPVTQPSRIFFYAFWNDRLVCWTLFLAIGLNLALLGILAMQYPYLAPTVEMRFNAAGEVVELRPRHQVLFLPLAAFSLCLLNTGLGLFLYKYDQIGAKLLQMASVLVQILFGVAIVAILLR